MKISKDKLQRAFRNFDKLKLCSQLKISRDTFWRILNWMIVPIFGSLSYFFVSEAWSNHRFGRTNLSFDEVPVEGHPTMVICMEHPISDRHFPLAWLEPIELYYYKVPYENLVSGSISKMKLEFGNNYLDDENIVLSQVGFCYSVTPKPLENYHHKKRETRYVKIVFPNEETLISVANTNIPYYEAFYYNALRVFFTHEDNALSIGMGQHWQEREAFEIKMIRQVLRQDMIAITELKTKKTQYIKEKTACTDKRINLETLGPVLGPDLALAVEKECLCYPKEFPLELVNSTIPFCHSFFDEM